MAKIADSLALKCRAVTYNNQIRKKSLCENAVNHIFMFMQSPDIIQKQK